VVFAPDVEAFTTELSSTGPIPLRDLCAMLFPSSRGSVKNEDCPKRLDLV
jgi:hypothetical protein